MKVIIIGAGMGGLSASIALQKQGHTTVIYERVTDLRPVGAAISVWSNGVKVMDQLGLGDRVRKQGGRMDRMAYRKFDDGRTYCDFDITGLYDRVKERAYPIARSDLQAILLDGARPAQIHLGRKATGYEALADGSGVKVVFADGAADVGDFLIIADGTHSKFRDQVCRKAIERKYVGYVNWNGAIEKSRFQGLLDGETWTQYVGEGKRVSFMPMSPTHFYFFLDVALPPSSTKPSPDTYRAELWQHFSHWNDAVTTLISSLEPSKVARVEICDTDPLPTLVDAEVGRVALIGDAAHATAPDLGQGGCQAMEDTFVLADMFAKAGITASSPPAIESLRGVLAGYQALRADRVALLVLRARKRASVTHALAGMAETREWYDELEGEDGSHVMEGIARTILSAPPELDAGRR